VHAAAWPAADELFAAAGGEDERAARTLELAAAVLGEIRKKKSEEQRPLKTAVAKATVRLTDGDAGLIERCESDLKASGLIQELVIERADTFDVAVELVPPEAGPQQEQRA
jgi:hypothetical protein